MYFNVHILYCVEKPQWTTVFRVGSGKRGDKKDNGVDGYLSIGKFWESSNTFCGTCQLFCFYEWSSLYCCPKLLPRLRCCSIPMKVSPEGRKGVSGIRFFHLDSFKLSSFGWILFFVTNQMAINRPGLSYVWCPTSLMTFWILESPANTLLCLMMSVMLLR